MRIGAFDTTDRVLVVAEIGNNHEGSIDVACRLVEKAAESGADAVKFQTFRTELFVSPRDPARFSRLKSFQLTPEHFARLAELAHSQGLLFISTPLDLPSAASLEPLVDAYKIASGDNDFYPLVRQVAHTGKPLIISSGLATEETLRAVVDLVRTAWTSRSVSGELALLHCVSSYPVPPDQVNLRSIPYLGTLFDCTIGYSDHTTGILAPQLAVALGARIIEKHFTLDKQFSDFRDHQLSADPRDVHELVTRIREIDPMLGRVAKTVQPCENQGVVAFRRSIGVAGDRARGHALGAADLIWVRPGSGIRPGNEHLLVGRTLRRDVGSGELISLDDLE